MNSFQSVVHKPQAAGLLGCWAAGTGSETNRNKTLLNIFSLPRLILFTAQRQTEIITSVDTAAGTTTIITIIITTTTKTTTTIITIIIIIMVGS